MFREAMYHVPRDKWAYAYDLHTIHLRFRTKKNDVDRVTALTGDKYDWNRTYFEVELEKAATDEYFDYWEGPVRPNFKRVAYIFRLIAGSEILYKADNELHNGMPMPTGGYYEFPYIHKVDLFAAPDWAKKAIFYQIMPDRFANGDPSNDPPGTLPWGGQPNLTDSFGGDLRGVLNHIDYLVELGINAIYFTPVFTANSYHKYDTIDYKTVDPHLGDSKMLKKLVEACHSKGIRVILDAVFNHCSDHFPPFQDVVAKGPYSPYADWFHVNEFPLSVKDGIPTYDTFGFYSNMPKFNTGNEEVRKYLLGVAKYWIQEIGVDGWRLDVADEVDHHFWREFRDVVKAAKPDAYLVGEVWSDSLSWLMGDQFDSVMNYPFSDKVLAFFGGGMDGYQFASHMGSLLMRYPQQTNEVVFNMLCSHDTPRLLTRLGGDKRKLKLAIVFLFTYMGTPCIFYGDEIGLQGGADPDCRKCMEWNPSRQDRELFNFYRMMIVLRKNNAALRGGRFRFLMADSGNPCIVYERINDHIHFTFWMNNTDQARTLSHPIETDDWRDALTGENVPTAEGQLAIPLDPYGYRILYRNLDRSGLPESEEEAD